MSDSVLFARQPIFDAHQNIYAYELLFRDNAKNSAEFIDGDLATRSVLLNAFAENNVPKILNGKIGFMNFTRPMLQVLPKFAKQFLVAEIVEQEHSSESLDSLLKHYRAEGYRIALDDFDIVNYRESLIDAAHVVKLDVLQYSKSELAKACDLLSQHSVQLLAEKVEDHDMLRYCQSLGFDYFQGYFFCKPELVSGRVLDSNRQNIFALIHELYRNDMQFHKVIDIVKRDTVLSFKLLKLVNSSFYRRVQEIQSIDHAVILLGAERIRSWATLVSMGRLNNKPDELQTESLLRANMCEKLSEVVELEESKSSFSVGLLSCLDAWFDMPLAQLFDSIPFNEVLTRAVIERTGQLGDILQLVVDFLHTDLETFDPDRLQHMGIDAVKLAEAYEFAVERTDESLAVMR